MKRIIVDPLASFSVSRAKTLFAWSHGKDIAGRSHRAGEVVPRLNRPEGARSPGVKNHFTPLCVQREEDIAGGAIRKRIVSLGVVGQKVGAGKNGELVGGGGVERSCKAYVG